MSITLYSKYRRHGLRRAWHLAGMNTTAAYVAAGLVALFAAYVFVAWIEQGNEEAERIGRQHGAAEREGLERSAKALAHAMNGGTLTDGKTLYFFQVSKQEGL